MGAGVYGSMQISITTVHAPMLWGGGDTTLGKNILTVEVYSTVEVVMTD